MPRTCVPRQIESRVMSRDAALVIGVINFIGLGPAILHGERRRWLPPLKQTGVRNADSRRSLLHAHRTRSERYIVCEFISVHDARSTELSRALMTGECPRESAHQAVTVTGCNSREHARPT